MKNYKYLMPVFLVAGMGLAWYSTLNTAAQSQEKYEEYVKKGDDYAGQSIVVDALENYNAAIEIKDSPSLRIKIVDLYINEGEEDEIERYAGKVMSAFPKDSLVYEHLMKYYIENNAYEKAFSLFDKAKAAGVVTALLEASIASIQYTYQILENGYTDVMPFVNGIAVVGSDGNWGYITESGGQLLSDSYETATSFMGKFACVKTRQEEEKKSVWQLIDIEGNKRRNIPEELKIKEAGIVSGNVYCVKLPDETYCYLTTDGDVWKEGFSYAGTFSEGFSPVLDESGYHLINTDGEAAGGYFERIAVDELGIAVRQDCFFGKKGEQYSLYKTNGEQLGVGGFQDVIVFNGSSYAAVKQADKWGFIDEKGRMVIEPQYEEARSFSNGFAAVKTGGKWGFINEKNEMCIEPSFSEAKDFNTKGNVFVKENGIWSLLSLYCCNYK